tara:strand:+ start:49 stop:624 length:576 start_codon:yes stop_codon:yes gene_type:complete
MGGDSSSSDGSAGGVREDRPRGALTGVYDNDPDSKTYDQRVGPTPATPNRSNLPGSTAADIAFNPLSQKSTTKEKAIAAAQVALPGGFLLGGARTLNLMGGRDSREKGRGSINDEFGDSGGNQNVREAIKTQASAAKTSKAATNVKAKTETRRAAGVVQKATKTTRAKTILSGAKGLLGDAPVRRKTLLGG